MNKKNIKIIVSIILTTVLIVAGLITYFVFFSEDKLVTAVNKGDTNTAVAYYGEHIAGNENKVNKYKDIFSKKLDNILQDFTETKIDFKTAEAQTRAIKKLNILQKANEIYDKIILINNSRTAMAAGEKAEKSGDYKQALIEFGKVVEKSDLLQSKVSNVVTKYKSDFEMKLDTALNSGEYETAKALFTELKEILPNDTNFCSSQEKKIVNLLQAKIDNKDIDNGIKLFDTLNEFISDKATLYKYSELLAEAKSWEDYANVKAKAKSFMVGEWKREDGSKFDGMIVKCNGVEAMAVGTVVAIPNTKQGFNIGDTKWSSMSVKDENTLNFRDMVKKDTGEVSAYRYAEMKFNRANNTIKITYDIIDNAYASQTQIWKKIK